MSVIITATDFSDIADQAVNYACQLASQQGASVLIFHSFIVPFTYTDDVTPVPVIPVDDLMKITEENMNNYVVKQKALFPGLNITTKILYGDIIDSIEEYIEHTTPWMVVLGNTGEPSTLFGSTALTALRNLKCPVLAIPAGTAYKPVKNICLAVNEYSDKDAAAIHELMGLAQQLGAGVHVLQVKGAETTSENSLAALHQLLEPVHPEYHVVENKSIDDGIQQFIATANVDWLAIIPHKHSFFENLFHKSHTQAMVKRSNIPVIAFHEGE